jgi:hypothetical protein
MDEQLYSSTEGKQRPGTPLIRRLMAFRLERGEWQELVLGLALLGIAYGLFVACLPPALDWHFFFYPVARSWREPYRVTGLFHNPPWLAFLLAPFGLLPETHARAAFVLVSLAMLIDTARTLGAGRTGTVATILAPPAMSTLANGQIDILALWGSTLGLRALKRGNPWLLSLGLLLISTKPQVAAPVGLLLWLQSKDKIRPLILPAAAVALSFVIYGWWPAEWEPVSLDVIWNVSAWPWGLVAGIVLFAAAYALRSHITAYLSTPLLSPYLAGHSLVGMSTAGLSAIPAHLAFPLLFLWWLLHLIASRLGGI